MQRGAGEPALMQLKIKNMYVENNKIISEFMGYRWNAYPLNRCNNLTKPGAKGWFYCSCDKDEFDAYVKEYFKYDTSWGWLMPVIEKIETTVLHEELKECASAFTVSISGNWCEVIVNSQYAMAFPEIDYPNIYEKEDSKIKSTYKAVVKFIEWYNQR